MTRQELDRLKSLKPNISYTQDEVSFMLEVTQQNVDPHARVCTSCSSSIAELKQKLFGWLGNNEQTLLEAIEAKENEDQKSQLEKIQQQVKNYTNGRE